MTPMLPFNVFLILYLLAWSTCLSASSSTVRALDVYLAPLTVTNVFIEPVPAKVGINPSDANNALLDQSPMLSTLEGASVTVDFPANTILNGLAIPRVGWGDWAVPAEVSISIDGVSLGSFSLEAPRHNPNNNKPKPNSPPPVVTTDVIDFGQARSVRQLRVTVEKIDTTSNKHGILKVCAYKPAPIGIDLNPVGGVPADSEGIELILDLDSPTPRSGLFVTASVYQFRRSIFLVAPIPVLNPGQNRVRVLWEQFAETSLPPIAVAVSPQHFNSFSIGTASPDGNQTDLSLSSWSFLKTAPGVAAASMPPPAWEQIPQRQFQPNSEGWRPGILSDGFGRFGWLQNNGLLVGTVGPDRFSVTVTDGQGINQTANWSFSLGDASVLNWSRTTVDWTSVRHDSRFDFSGEMRNELAAKAPQLLKETRFAQTVTASILAPGFLIDSRDRRLAIEATDVQVGQSRYSGPRILASTINGLRWFNGKESLAGSDLSEGWIIAEWPDREGIPMLLVLQNKPESIHTKGTALELDYQTELGRVGVAFPFGYFLRDTKQGIDSDAALAQRARQISAILRAYPLSATQAFRIPDNEPNSIEIRETIRHLEWENEWGEPAHRVAPLPPLIHFAASQNYPVTLPENLIETFQWPTKTGFYTVVGGDTITYRIPIPERGTRLYLRPSGPDELADHVAKEIFTASKPSLKNIQIDGLYSWWMQAPSSLAFPLLNPEQQKVFLEGWRTRLGQALRPNAWFLRREPFSQAPYPVSFAWVEGNTGTLGDLNSGLGAVLYAAWAYARSSGDWAFIEQHWPVLRGAFEYYLVQHDWNNMQTGAREHSASSAIDMDGIGYEGAIAFAIMAEKLGYADEAALGRLLVARLGLSTSMRWLGNAWVRSDLPREQWNSVGLGLSEFVGFDMFGARHGGPDHAASEIALSLSWVGQYPELYDLHVRSLGRDFWEWFENDFVENKMENWRKDHPGNRNNHAANITAHLYMRGILGAPSSTLVNELSQQSKWGLEPRGAIAQENAALYGMIIGKEFPLSLVSWGRAAILEAVYDSTESLATLRFESDHAGELVLDLADNATLLETVILNGIKANFQISADGTKLHLPLPVGSTRYELQFSKEDR